MAEKKKLNSNQREMLQRRGLDPKHYTFVGETLYSLYVRNIHTGKVMIIFKHK